MSSQPITDPTGDRRAAFLARLEYDLRLDAGRTAIEYPDTSEGAQS